jgi:hypothetical protein
MGSAGLEELTPGADTPETGDGTGTPEQEKPATIAGAGDSSGHLDFRNRGDRFLRVLGDGFPLFRPICGRLFRTSDALNYADLRAPWL